MKRSLIEWLLISAVGFFLGSVGLLAFSSHPSWSPIPFSLVADNRGSSVYVLIRETKASVFNQIDFNTPGSPKPLVLDPRTLIFPKASVNHELSIPGIAFHYCRMTTGTSVWSLEFSLVIPAVLSCIVTVLLFRRFRRQRRQDGAVRIAAT